MSKSEKNKLHSAYLIGVIVIFLAGFVIFFFNLYKGTNLFTKEPENNILELIESKKSDDPLESFKMLTFADEVKKAAEKKKSEPQEEIVETESGIYFTDFFLKEDPIATYNYINEFWNNINASEDVIIEDLYATNCFDVEVPAENRQESLEQLKANEDLKELKAVEPPMWQVCYKKSYYQEQMDDFFASIDASLIIEENENDYVARMENDLSEEELQKIEEMYSDVIEIKN